MTSRHSAWVKSLRWLLSALFLFSFFSNPASAATEFAVAPGAHAAPRAIVAGPDGNLWFVELTGRKVGRITPTGTLTEIPIPGSFILSGIAVGSDGNIWFSDGFNPQVGNINPGTLAVTTFPIVQNANATGITAGPDGALWFAEQGAQKVGRITTAGVITEFPTGPNTDPWRITTGADGNLWFSNAAYSFIGRMTTAGVVTLFPIPSGAVAGYLAPGPDGNVWFVEGTIAPSARLVARITPAGVITEYSTTGFPMGIAQGPDGRMWIRENGGGPSKKIGAITTAGVLSEYGLPGVGGGGGITSGPDGALWVTGQNSDDIGRVTTSGVVSNTYGGLDHGSTPSYITAGPDGNVWFTEQNPSKVGKITPTGTITDVVTPTPGSGPQGITTGSDGNLWFVEEFAGKIARTTTAGVISEFQVTNPSRCDVFQIASGSDGNLWVPDDCAPFIYKFTTAGVETNYPLPAGATPLGITSGPDGNLWYTDPGRNVIGQITVNGGVTEFPIPEAKATPVAITVGPDNNLWFVNADAGINNGGTIGRITTAGVITLFNTNLGGCESAITAGADGNLWTPTDDCPGLGQVIASISTNGVVVNHDVVSAEGIIGITTGPDKKLWFADFDNGAIERMSAVSGSVVLTPSSGANGVSISAQGNFVDGNPTALANDFNNPSSTLDWGDGSGLISALVISGPTGGPFAVAANSHIYNRAGSYTVKLTLHDSVDNEDYPATANATVGNATTTSLVASQNPANLGFEVVFTAHVSAAAGAPTGNVLFEDAFNAVLATVPVNANGNASFATSALPLGNVQIFAVYTGDTNFITSTSPTLIEQIGAAGPAQHVVNVSANAFTDPATGTSTTNVNVGDTVLWVWQAGAGAHSTTEGSCLVAPCFSDDDDWDSGVVSDPYNFSVTFGQTGTYQYFDRVLGPAMTGTIVVQKAASTTVLQVSPNPVPAGASGTATATVSSAGGVPTGNVIFMDGTNVIDEAQLNNGVAQITGQVTLPQGLNSITAVYQGDPGFNGSTSSAVGLTVGPPQFESITLSPPQALVASAGATVQFAAIGHYSDGSTQDLSGQVIWSAQGSSATVSPAGLATAVSAGTAFIEATYNQVNYGANFTVGTDYPLFGSGTSFTVTAGASFTQVVGTFTDGDPNAALTNLSANINWGDASGSPGTITQTGPSTFAVSGTHAYALGAVGTNYTITTTVSDIAGANLVINSTALSRYATTTALASSVNPSTLGQPVTFTATVTVVGQPIVASGNVTFTDNGTNIGSSALNAGVATLTVTNLASGQHNIVAFNAGGPTAEAPSQSAPLVQTVNQADVGVTASASPAPTTAGTTETFTVIVNNNGPGIAHNVILSSGSFFNNINSVSATQGSCSAFELGNSGCNLGTLNSGASATVTILATLDFSFGGTFTTKYFVSADEPDNNQANNSYVVMVTFNAAKANHFQIVSGCSRSGVPFGISVAASDAFQNVDPTYAGTVQLTSSDPGVSNPILTYTFVATDSGIHTFNNAVTLQAPGPHTVTATDTVSGITGTATVVVGNVTGCFQPGLMEPINLAARDSVSGDFNGDGKPDVATAGNGALAIVLGNGDGTFQSAAVTLFANNNMVARKLLVGDFNGDGKLDVVAVGKFPNPGVFPMAVFLGNGNGTFQAPTYIGQGFGAAQTGVAGDFNRDGKLDVAVDDSFGDLVVFLGNGDGTFQAPQFFPGYTLSPPQRMVAADFNGDGKLDIAMPDQNGNVFVLLGNGDGTFQPPQVFQTLGSDGFDITAGDFNRDGKMDLAVSNILENTVSVLLGNGDGTFQPAATFPTGPEPFSLAALDMNHDGKLDLVVDAIGGLMTNNVQVLIGNGDGTFQPPSQIGTASPIAGRMAVADFNRDGAPDVFLNGGISLDIPGLLLNIGNAEGNPTFAPPIMLPSQGGALAVVVDDFNHDGIPDIAVANNDVSGTVNIELGHGDGTFAPPQAYPTSSTTVGGFAKGDLNRDGNTDLVVSHGGSNSVSVLLGKPDGTFQPPVDYSVGNVPSAVAVADINNDGKPDIIVGNNISSGGAGVLLGNGDGTFAAATSVTGASGSVSSVAVADLNGDGKPDLVLVSGAGAEVLLGNGNGTFGAATTYTADVLPLFVRIADVNRDGIPDLVVVNGGSNDVSILLGTGSGTFSTAVNYPVTASHATSVDVTDLNGDGIPDLVVTGDAGTVLSVLYGTGNGTFQAAVSYPANSTAEQVVAADLNGDAVPDLVIANDSANHVSVLLGIRNNLQVSGTYNSSGTTPDAVATGDFNGDGKDDMAIVNSGSNNVSIRLNQGDGSFKAATGSPYTVGTNPKAIVVGDFNKDGKLDLAVANLGSDNVTILLGNGDGTFTIKGSPSTGAGSAPAGLVVGDFNNDGNLDLAVTDSATGNLSILYGNGDGTFQAPVTFSANPGHGPNNTGSLLNPKGITSADLNGDGKLDLIVANSTGTTITVLLNNGSGGFPANLTTSYSVGTHPVAVAVADFNGDGHPDIAVANQGSNNVTVLFNQGNGTFGSPVTLAVGNSPLAILAFDYNSDGKPDIAVANSGDNTISVLLGNGNGTFQSPLTLSVGNGPASLVSGNFTGAGVTDLLTANGSANSVTVVVNNRGTLVNATSPGPVKFGTLAMISASVASAVTGLATPTGTLQPMENGVPAGGAVPLVGGQGTVSTMSLGAGPHSISLFYSGNSSYNSATSNMISQLILQADTSSAVASSLNPSALGQPVTFTATITSQSSGSITGTVAFKDGANVLCGAAPLNAGVAVCTTSSLAQGSHTITASYSGDANFLTSSATLAGVQQVQKAQSFATLAASTPSSVYGSAVTFTATISSTSGTPTGNVTFFDGATSLGSIALSGGVAQLTTALLAAGQHSVTVQYGGDSNNAAGISSALNQTVNKAQTSVTIQSSANPSTLNTPVTFTVTVNGVTVIVSGVNAAAVPSGSITFNNGTANFDTKALVSGGASSTTSNLEAGVKTVTASYGGDGNYLTSSNNVVQVVNKAGLAATVTTLGISSSASAKACVGAANCFVVLRGQGVTLTATVSSATAGTAAGFVTFVDGQKVLGLPVPVSMSGCSGTQVVGCTIPLLVNQLTIGDHHIQAVYGGDNVSYGGSAPSPTVEVRRSPKPR